MTKFLTTNGTSYHIENVIIRAQQKLVLVSPYLQLSKTFFERLKDACARRIDIIIVYGKDELKPNERNSLAELEGLQLFFFENLHAKCYFNEEEMVITSMNMYEFSEKNNREMGVFIEKSKDESLYNQAVSEAESIIQSSEQIGLSKTKRKLSATDAGGYISSQSKNKTKKPKRGYCIRCEERIAYNIDRPYCKECFTSWVQFENYDYKENVCHGCGEFESSSMNKPVCYSCFKEYEKIPASTHA